ncbi:MAG: DnaJ domain-containing protein [Candidatus Sericytochromatia bacterium]
MDIDDDNLWRVNLFDVLGIKEETSKDDMKNVYKQLAKKYHPDRFPAGSPAQAEAKEKFSGINRAYEVLSNDAKRHQYLDTRRLLADHLAVLDLVTTPEQAAQQAHDAQQAQAAQQPQAAPPPAAAPAASPPAAQQGQGHKKINASGPPKEDYKTKEAEDAFKEGNVQFGKNDLDGAITSYQRAITILPDQSKYHSNLGRAYMMKGWKGMAQSAFKQALVLNPNDALAKKHYEPEKAKKKGLLDGLLGRFKKDE